VQKCWRLSRPNTYCHGLPHVLLKPQSQNTDGQNVDDNEGEPRLAGGGCEVIRKGYATEEVEDDFGGLIKRNLQMVPVGRIIFVISKQSFVLRAVGKGFTNSATGKWVL
jgi:hypothetical protein